jgi:hypothetical protein
MTTSIWGSWFRTGTIAEQIIGKGPSTAGLDVIHPDQLVTRTVDVTVPEQG